MPLASVTAHWLAGWGEEAEPVEQPGEVDVVTSPIGDVVLVPRLRDGIEVGILEPAGVALALRTPTDVLAGVLAPAHIGAAVGVGAAVTAGASRAGAVSCTVGTPSEVAVEVRRLDESEVDAQAGGTVSATVTRGD